MAGAFVLGAPGTYVVELDGTLVVGNRPDRLHHAIAAGVPAVCLVLVWILRHEDVWWLGAGALVLFGVPAALVAFNTQRYEITPGRLAMRGRAAAVALHRDWLLPAGASVRIGTRLERNEGSAYLWTAYQAQILTTDGWIAVAESMHQDQVLEFAERLARAARVSVRPR